MIVRDEAPGDIAGIRDVTRAAFGTHPHSHQTEHLIVDALRAAGALAVSLVAEQEGRVVGHVAFSSVRITDGSGGWFGLGPVSVLPAWQRRGFGASLIQRGLARLRDMHAEGCVLVGEPDYYRRFGFARKPALEFDGVPQEYFLALDLRANDARGKVVYHTAFSIGTR